VEVALVLALLAGVGVAAQRVAPIPGGWAYWTFDVDGTRIVRFPRNEKIATATERELALLPELARSLRFAVPVPEAVGQWDDKPFFVYQRISGSAVDPQRCGREVLSQVAAMLDAIHAFDVDRAAALLGAGPPKEAWRRYFERLWPDVVAHALPVMSPALAHRVEHEFGEFLSRVDEVPCCLIHNDLGTEHILVDGSRLVGMIDFESAWIGDPLVDFWPLWQRLPAERRAEFVGTRDFGARVPERRHFYRWMGSVHAIMYGVTGSDDAELAAGLAELPRRMDAPVS
jgi:aminoglycoside phosphotransferase (APT) family kinase protein